jgi:thioredoxin reductase (NADPH)
MSDYLVRQLGETPNLDVRLSTRVVDGRGRSHLEALTLEDVGERSVTGAPSTGTFSFWQLDS